MKYHEMIREIPEARLEAEGLIFPENLQIQSFDLGIIIGNALDNALEACRKLKCKRPEAECFIRLCSFQKGKMFFVEVENSCERGIIKKPHSEFPKTDKEDKSAHGMGLMNIKNTAERYDGGVDWSVSAGVFTLSVMMKNERRREYVY